MLEICIISGNLNAAKDTTIALMARAAAKKIPLNTVLFIQIRDISQRDFRAAQEQLRIIGIHLTAWNTGKHIEQIVKKETGRGILWIIDEKTKVFLPEHALAGKRAVSMFLPGHRKLEKKH